MPCGRSPLVSGPPPELFVSYLQPGVVVVCPGGWHLAPGSFGPLSLAPGPKLPANAAPETDIVNAISTAATNNVMRFLISSHLLSLFLQKHKNRLTSNVKR